MPVEADTPEVEVGGGPDATLAGLDALELVAAPHVSRTRRAWSATWPKLAAVALALAVWELTFRSGWKEPYQLPPFGDVWPVLQDQLADGELTSALALTMRRALVGFLIATAIGVTIGAAVSRSKVLRSAVGSLITGLQTMPSVAWYPLGILLFGLEEATITFVVVLGAAPSIANGLIAGVDTVPPILLRAGRVLGARGLAAWRHVILPAALPSFLGGMKQGWAFSWRSLMAGELIVQVRGTTSVGTLLEESRAVNDAEGVIAAMLLILAIGIVVDAVLFATAERNVRRRYGLEVAPS